MAELPGRPSRSGDIPTDEAAALAGSLRVLPSASLHGKAPERPDSPGKQFGPCAPIHGPAPDSAGQDRANPLGAIRSAALLPRLSRGLEEEAHTIERAVEAVVADGLRTGDSAEAGAKVVGARELGRTVTRRIAGA